MERHKFEFTGNAKEYFGIWIVNLVLSIITVGIYTAWAKVRRVRYFYANTHLDGHNFEYHARPKSILIGRIIVVGFIIILNVLVNFTPYAFLLLIPYFIALPWVINQALRFNARVTSYRNVRFNFAGTYWQAAKVYLLLPIGGMIATGLIVAPIFWMFSQSPIVLAMAAIIPFAMLFLISSYVSKLSANYIGNNLSYGDAGFQTSAKYKAMLGNSAVTLLFGIVVVAVLLVVGYFLAGIIHASGMLENTDLNQGDAKLNIGIFTITFVAIYPGIILTMLFYGAGVRNIAYNATLLDKQHELQSNLARWKYTWILASNLLATMATIGLLRPWAAIRSWRYIAEHTALLAKSDLSYITEQRRAEGAAASAEFLDIEGIDFGL